MQVSYLKAILFIVSVHLVLWLLWVLGVLDRARG